MNADELIFLTGRHVSRTAVLVDCRRKIAAFLQRDPREDATLHFILREIIKNIHDHNGCWGIIAMKRMRHNIVAFKIQNLPNPQPETNEHQPEERVNYGVGLDLSKQQLSQGIRIKLADKILYKYIIIYKYSLHL